jgi:hypothetical protein
MQRKTNNEDAKEGPGLAWDRLLYLWPKGRGWDKDNFYNVNCFKCGNYTLKDLAFRLRLIRGTKRALTNAERERLSKGVKAAYAKGKGRVLLSADKIDKLVDRPPKPIRINVA